jgi:hypothetical protein
LIPRFEPLEFGSFDKSVSCIRSDVDNRELGETGIHLPVIGLGTWQYVGDVESLRAGMASNSCPIGAAGYYRTEEIAVT